jgi:hypothetical protein
MQLSCLLITNFKVTINAYYIYIRYWLQRNVEIRVAIQKAGGDKVQPHFALPHMPEAVTAFLQMVFGVLERQLAAPQLQSLQPASYRPSIVLREGCSMI